MPGRPVLLEGPEEMQGYVYQEFIENSGWDYKLYGIDEGKDIKVFGARQPSPLNGSEGDRIPIELDEDLTEVPKDILKLFDARVLSIDMIEGKVKRYVVDVNSAPNPRGIPGIKESLSNCLKNLVENSKKY